MSDLALVLHSLGLTLPSPGAAALLTRACAPRFYCAQPPSSAATSATHTVERPPERSHFFILLQGRAEPRIHAALPMYHAAAAAGQSDDAATEEPAIAPGPLRFTMQLHPQRGAKIAAWAADTHGSGIPTQAARLATVPYPGDNLIAGPGEWAAEQRLSADGAQQMDTWPGVDSEADGVSEAEAPVMMGKRLSDLAAARLEPHLWRLQVGLQCATRCKL